MFKIWLILFQLKLIKMLPIEAKKGLNVHSWKTLMMFPNFCIYNFHVNKRYN